MNKEFERYNTKIEIPASVVLETIFSSDNKDVETLSRWALKYGFVDLVEKEDGKYYKLQDDYEKQSFYTYLSKKERKQYEYEDYLIEQIDEKEQEIERLNKVLLDIKEYIETNSYFESNIVKTMVFKDYSDSILDIVNKAIGSDK